MGPSVFGIRLGTIIFATIIIGGQFLFGLGALIQSFSLMQVGRFVFGIGGESLAVAQNTYAVSWFKGKELNMVFGFQGWIHHSSLSGFNSHLAWIPFPSYFTRFATEFWMDRVAKICPKSITFAPNHKPSQKNLTK